MLLVRNPAAARDLADQGAELVPGDLQNTAALSRLCRDSDYLVHCAGSVRGARYRDFFHSNVEGTRNLVNCLLQQASPVPILMLSSVVAGEPDLSWYARSKFEAENCLVNSGTRLNWTVLRPPAVYGPGDREMLPLFRIMQRGYAPVPGSKSARHSLIHVDDLVEAILCCLQSNACRGRVVPLHDGRHNGYDWSELAQTAGTVLGQRVRPLPIPAVLLNLVATANLYLARLTGRRPMLTPPKLRELRHPNWVVDNRDISAMTGWKPEIDLETGLREIMKTAF